MPGMIAAMPSFSTKPPTSDTPLMLSELSDTGIDPQSPRMLVQAAHTEEQRQAIELEASGLDVCRGRRLVAILGKKRIQALVLRGGRQRREEQEQYPGGDASPPESPHLHPLSTRTHTQG